ncbi:MAG: AI-2E family transporter [Phycisphaerales bacterium]
MAILYLARQVLVPVALAILLTFVVAPLVARIERRVHSRAIAVLLATLLVIGVLGGGLLFAGQQFAGLADEIPTYRDTIVRKVRSIESGPGGLIGRAAEAIRRISKDIAQSPADPPVDAKPSPVASTNTGQSPPVFPASPVVVTQTTPGPFAERAPPGGAVSLSWAIVAPIVEPLASAAIVILLLIMMLMSREGIRDRVIRLAGLHQIGLTTQTLEEAGSRVGRYLRTQLLLNTIFAASVATGLLIVGVPNAALCGLLAGVLRFIPVLGPWLAAAIPSALALAVFSGWHHVVIVLSIFAALELLNNFVLEPWLYGSSTGLSSLGIILALIFWTWVWGAVGLVLAVPMTVCVVVFTRHIPSFSGLWIMLGNEPVLSDSMRYYQRLLCRDEEEAAAVLASAPADADPVDVLDEIVVPSLSAARADLRRGLITRAQAARIGTAARELALEWLADRGAGRAAPSQAMTAGRVVCLPAQDGLDEAAGAVLVELLRREGFDATAASAALLFSERIDAAVAPGVGLIVISGVEPSSDLHTRRVLRALQQKAPGTAVIVATWAGEAPKSVPADQAAAADSRAFTIRQAITLVKSNLPLQPTGDADAVPSASGA